jgi:transcriptional regulator with GAF, ATPase, and Fis domain
LSACGVLTVLYCLAVLGFVATAPDIGLRCLLVNDPKTADQSAEIGLEIRQIVQDHSRDPREGPKPGDKLIEIARRPARTFTHFAARLLDLRSAEYPGRDQFSKIDLLEHPDQLPPVVQPPGGEERLVIVKFLHDGKGEQTWLPLRSVPWEDLVLTFIWFLLVFAIFSVGALAFWARPFDRQARVFFAMCTVTLGGFVGGFHWWMIAGSLWLMLPFVICAMLVPVVTLHFFMVYPEPKLPLARHPYRSVIAIYAIPMLWITAVAGLVVYLARTDPSDFRHVERTLVVLNEGIYIYLGIAATYFVAALLALFNSFFTTRNPILHDQVKWILWAAVVATVPVGYSLSLAYFQKEKFALGAASFPMFTASLLFMLAYAIGIARFKLMLVDEILSRGMVYYILSLAVTVGFSLAIATGSLAAMYEHVHVARHAPVVVALVVVAVFLLNWSRDRLQHIIDRRYFREKFQLDKALQQMNHSAGKLVDPTALAERMLASCRDLLGVDRAALYLRDTASGTFELVAASGVDRAPPVFETEGELLGFAQEDAQQRRFDSENGELPASPLLLQQLEVELVHALEVEGRLSGALLLGPKRNGTQYSAEDLALLTSLGQITSIALASARVHMAVQRLNDELQLKVEKITEQQRLISMLQSEITSRQQPPEPPTEPPPTFRRELIKGNSPAILHVLETVRKVSGSQSSVLIRGESGTGKELLATAIHENSPRSSAPMVSVHCGALSPGLLESELFGHVKGSFTGAHRDKIGRFEMANAGTLFLDEIGDISLETQIKLLRVLQEREFEPVGGTRTIGVDVRLIAATHQNLEKLISEGKFREDLFYRLNVISITLPSLRERVDDIIELALFFLNRAAERAGKRITYLEDGVIEALKRHPWPGNIRELENAIERSVVMAEGPQITLHDLPAGIAVGQPAQVLETKPVPGDTQRPQPAIGRQRPSAVVDGFAAVVPGERQALISALAEARGNKAEAARALGIPRSTFFSRLKKFGLD